MNPSNLALWAKKKGIDLVGTGDFTHPFWFSELRQNLVEIQNQPGFFNFKESIGDTGSQPIFALTVETSHIFSWGGKTRRIHLLVCAPSFEVAEKLNRELAKRGNIASDGRPILGLPCRDFLALALSISQDILIIPAHVWTPWFGLYGANGGGNSIEEIFGDLSSYIYAVETGLSSDPAMNWRIPELEDRRIVSFSDAHSLEKLGREATVFDLEELSYENVREAIMGEGLGSRFEVLEKNEKNNKLEPKTYNLASNIAYTIEFHPEEGKYHYTGHRNCEVVQTPEETKLKGTTCPVCKRLLTVGVMHRVEELGKVKSQSSKVKSQEFDGLEMVIDESGKHPPYVMTVPLMEILAESLGVATGTQKVAVEYEKLISHFGSEFNVLLKTSIEEIIPVGGDRISEGIKRVREGRLVIDPGYDGVFGKVNIWGEKAEKQGSATSQQSLF